MVQYGNEYNPILEYEKDIEKGKINACNKIKKTYKHLVTSIKEGSKWHYDSKRGNHILEFFENFLIPSKVNTGGKPLPLELWEKAMLAAAFGIVDREGKRRFNRVVLIVGKKNGKSYIASGVGLYGLTADRESGPEIYSVATKRDQAKIIWEEAKKMRNKSAFLRKYTKTTISDITCQFNEGVFKPLASDTDSMDGMNVFYVLMDEFHQWRNGRPLYNIMADGTSAREEPLIFMTSTAGTVREDIYDEIYAEGELTINAYDDPDAKYDERTLYLFYELDAKEEWMVEECWIKANPNLGVSKTYKYLKEKVSRAKIMPQEIKNLVCKEFNIRETSGEAWLSFEEIDNREKFDINELKPKYGIGGFDLSKTTDLTAAVVIFMVKGSKKIYVECMFWIPEELVEARIREGIPYDKWLDTGYIRTCEGNKINYKDIKSWFLEVQNEKDIYLPWIGYDGWSATYLIRDMEESFGKESMEMVRQGKQTLSQPMLELGADIKAKRVIYNNNPILKWCMTNVAVDKDINGNVQPIKAENAKQRIDGFAALLDAYVAMTRHMEEYLSII